MRYAIFTIFLVLTSCSSEEIKPLEHDCSSLLLQGEKRIIENAYYELTEEQQIFLIKERKVADDSTAQNQFTITRKDLNSDNDVWAVSFEGENYEFTKNSLITDISNSNTDRSYAIYSLNSGDLLLEYTYDKQEVRFGDDQKQSYFAYYSNKGVKTDFSQANSNKNTLGFLRYANQDQAVSAIRIEASDPMWLDILDVSNPVIELIPIEDNAIQLNAGKTLFFTSHDGADDKGVDFDVKIIFYTTDTYKPVEFVLQVRDNVLILHEDFTHSVFHLVSL